MDCPLLGRLSEPPPSKGQRMRKEEREARVFQEIFLLPRPGLGKEAREAVMDLHEEAKTPGHQRFFNLGLRSHCDGVRASEGTEQNSSLISAPHINSP